MSLRTYQGNVSRSYVEHVSTGVAPADWVPSVFGAPCISSAKDIAEYIGVSNDFFENILYNIHKNYRVFQISKRSGEHRLISAPRTYLKVVQWWILDVILSNFKCNDNCFGFVSGKSFVDCARVHYGSNYVLNIDVKDFFPSISERLVYECFKNFGYNNNVARVLTRLTTLDGGLPQGAPTSPCISNIILNDMDIELSQFFDKVNIKYTRYADDITISSRFKIDSSYLEVLSRNLSQYDLIINENKVSFMGDNDQKEITGVVLARDGVALSKNYLNRCRGWFYSCYNNPVENQSDLNRIRSTISHIEQVGGRGSRKVAQLGRQAVERIVEVKFNAPA